MIYKHYKPCPSRPQCSTQLKQKHDGYKCKGSSVCVAEYKEFDIAVNSYSLDLVYNFFISKARPEHKPDRYLDENGVLQKTATYFQSIIDCVETIDKYYVTNKTE